ncbi:MAG: hypothetical protein ACFE95_08340 [Candidatus Hodarchaeota archaeon]
MILLNEDEHIIESYTFSEWPLKLRTGKITLTNKSFYAVEGTWGFKTSIQCRYEEIIHMQYKDSLDYAYIFLGIVSLLLYFFLITIPLAVALIHMGIQKQLIIGLEGYGLKKIHGPQDVLLRVLNQVTPKTRVIGRPIPKVTSDQPIHVQQDTIDKRNRYAIQEKSSKIFEPSLPQQPPILAPPFYCEICANKHSAGTKRMQCEQCGRSICIDSFAEMAKVGRVDCPLCDGKLSAL